MRTQLKIYYCFCNHSFPCGSAGKESACDVGVPGFDPWVGKIPWRRERLPTSVSWPGEFHRLYSPWGHKQLDRTEALSLSLFFNCTTFTLNNLYDSLKTIYAIGILKQSSFPSMFVPLYFFRQKVNAMRLSRIHHDQPVRPLD